MILQGYKTTLMAVLTSADFHSLMILQGHITGEIYNKKNKIMFEINLADFAARR